MKRRTLLALIACAGLAHPARADLPTIDIGMITQAVRQLEWLRDQYQVMTQQLRALSSSLDLGSIGQELIPQAIRNPFGSITSNLPNLVGGTQLGNMPGASQFLQQDRLFEATGNDFTATQMNSAATGLANLKAIAMQLINGNETRLSAIDGLQADLQGAEDVSQVERINGRINLENQALATQAAQFQQLQAMAELQRHTDEQRTLQRQRADDEAIVNMTKDQGTGGAMAPAPASPAFMAGGGG
jgi:hypothetical protein